MKMKLKKRKSSLKSIEKSRGTNFCRGSHVDRSSKQLRHHFLKDWKDDSEMIIYSIWLAYQRKDYLKKVKDDCKQTRLK